MKHEGTGGRDERLAAWAGGAPADRAGPPAPREARAVALLLGASLALGAGCGDDDGSPIDAGSTTDAGSRDTGPSDGATADTGPSDSGVPARFALHYHRPDRTYTGWTANVSGDVTNPGTLTQAAPDRFGAVFHVDLAPNARMVTFQLGDGTSSEPRQALTVDVSRGATGIWWFHGHDEALTSAPPAIPGPNQVAIYYVRGDQMYSGWGLHLWGDVARETQWTAPAPFGGVDPRLGAWWLVDVREGGNRVNLIVHMGDTKDPGPDMGFDIGSLGDIVFLRSGSADIYTVPQFLAAFQIDGMKAHWVAPGLLLYDPPPSATSVELRRSSDAMITVSDELDVVGGTAIPLGARSEALPQAVADKFPHLRSRRQHALPAAALNDARELAREQLVVVARDAMNKPVGATRVQMPGALDELFPYTGALGATFAGQVPTLRVWAPTAREVALMRYDRSLARIGRVPMTRDAASGTWSVTGAADWYGTFYRYEVTLYHPSTDGIETYEVTDPYSVSLSTNSTHSHIVDLANDPALKPAGWDELTLPALAAPEDVVIYEGHVRDFSIWDDSVPAADRGKYRAFTYDGTGGRPLSRGMSHLRTLAQAGLTVFHVLPSFDIATVNENPAARVDLTDGFDRLCMLNRSVPMADCVRYGTMPIRAVLESLDRRSSAAQQIATWLAGLDGFNWGYDPFHFNAPEGSYASDANGSARILEKREMVMSLARLGLRTAFDVVYNHTNASGLSDRSVLDKVVPGYYHRQNPDTGNVERSTCCDNTATEHAMMEKLMVDSLVLWARHYKVGAFRFDLMGHHMVRNMVAARQALDAVSPQIYMYGEGWDFGEVANNARGRNATQINLNGSGIGTFNDRLRDAVRGGGPFDGGASIRTNQGFGTGLFNHPNERNSGAPAERARLLELADLVRIGMAGNLRDFVLVDRVGSASTGRFITYNGAPGGYTNDPQEVINYVSKHDNQTLFDIGAYKMAAGISMDQRVRHHNLAKSTVLLGQGVPFMHMGDDLLRSKSMERDSYDSGDWYNRVDWTGMTNNWNVGLPNAGKDMANWPLITTILGDEAIAPQPRHIAAAGAHVQEMLRIRSSTVLFRLRTKEQVMSRVDFYNVGPDQVPGVIVQTITDGTCAGADLDPSVEGVVVALNATASPQTVTIPGAGAGFVLHPVLAASADATVRASSVGAGGRFTVPALTAAVFWQPQSGAQGAGLPCNTR